MAKSSLSNFKQNPGKWVIIGLLVLMALFTFPGAPVSQQNSADTEATWVLHTQSRITRNLSYVAAAKPSIGRWNCSGPFYNTFILSYLRHNFTVIRINPYRPGNLFRVFFRLSKTIPQSGKDEPYLIIA